MQSLWRDTDANTLANDPLALRVYTSRLLGREPSLVLHGGGNTSVKTVVTDLFGDPVDVIYVKGTGWDLATIAEEGFAPVRLDPLRRMADLPALSDSDMVLWQRSAMLDPDAPVPSIEAILHAIIPARFVDHTHADAVVALSNSPEGEQRLSRLYGDGVLLVPYVMPGFALARAVRDMTVHTDWSRLEGVVLLQHGLFTFADEAKESYERTIRLVSEAEEELSRCGALDVARSAAEPEDLLLLAQLRREASRVRGAPMLALLDRSEEAAGFAGRADIVSIATKGPLTPDHVIRTKPVPLIAEGNPRTSVERFAADYDAYFVRNAKQESRLDVAPRWGVWPGQGTLAFGTSLRDARAVADIARHTVRAIQWGELLGGWRPLAEAEIFAVEYWELEQAKLKKGATPRLFEGRIALVTGAGSGIGRASAEALVAAGATVVGVDIRASEPGRAAGPDFLELRADVSIGPEVVSVVGETVRRFGGLDLLVSNAGFFPTSQAIGQIDPSIWEQSLRVNLTSHELLLHSALPYLERGIDASVVIVGSKNVPAPGPGAASYSVAKAGLTQFARVAALELAPRGVRVNVVHPHAVFDTTFWTPAVLEERARRYGVTVDEYKKSNLLQREVRSADVAAVVCALLSPAFSRTTGAQVPIDGGNDRVI